MSIETSEAKKQNGWAFIVSPIDLRISHRGEPIGGWVVHFVGFFGDIYLTNDVPTKKEAMEIAQKFTIAHPGGVINPNAKPIAGEHPALLHKMPPVKSVTKFSRKPRKRSFHNREKV